VADPSDIITLQQAKDTLNITTTQYDTELPQYITAASVLWEMRVGPVAGSPTYDEFYNGGSPTIVVRHPPIQSVTSITESWGATTSYTLTDQVVDSGSNVGFYGYSVDLARGVFTRRASAVATTVRPGCAERPHRVCRRVRHDASGHCASCGAAHVSPVGDAAGCYQAPRYGW